MAVEIAGKNLKELAELKDGLVTRAQSFHTEHADDWTDDRDAQFNAMMDDAATCRDAMKRIQALNAFESSPESNPIQPMNPSANPGESAAAPPKLRMRQGREYVEADAGFRGSSDYTKAFNKFIHTRRGSTPLQESTGVGTDGISQYAALQSDDAEQAGFLVASEQFAAGLLKDVDDLLFIRRYAKIHTVPQASSLGIRKRTARMSTFGWTSELQVSTRDSSLKYGKKVLTPHHLTGSILLSRDLVRRLGSLADSEVRFEMARDSGETMEDGFLTGHGSQQPLGVFTASSDGISTSRDVSSGSTTSITADSLLNAKYALKSQYRTGARGGLRWLFHRDGIKIIAKLKDGAGQYLFQTGMGPSVQGGMPEDVLLGIPVDESERSPNTFTTGLYVGLLANWNYYEIADALDMEVQILYELNARTNQIEYIGRLKTDGMPTLEEAFVRLKTD